MPGLLVRKLALCFTFALPTIVFRITGFAPHPVLDLVVFGAAVVAASFVLAGLPKLRRKTSWAASRSLFSR